MPKLSSAQIRIDEKASKDDARFKAIGSLRETRDKALDTMADTNLKGAVSGKELAAVASASSAVLALCGLGTDYIQYRLGRNANTQFWYAVASGVFAVGTAGTVVIESAKAMGLTSVMLSNYKSNIVENGDSGHSNVDLKKVLDEVRSELAGGLHRYNFALLLPNGTTSDKLTQFRHLQAAVLEMNNACAFF